MEIRDLGEPEAVVTYPLGATYQVRLPGTVVSHQSCSRAGAGRHTRSPRSAAVERIAFGEGLRVVRKHLRESDGFVEDNVLTVNAEHARTRQRFTIAHELGHLVLHAEGTDKDSEREADQFAGALLIPRAMLRDAVAETPDLNLLRRGFNVSREALLSNPTARMSPRSKRARPPHPVSSNVCSIVIGSSTGWAS
jgi:Zn-dependent peptidase ImmA (M78 family)